MAERKIRTLVECARSMLNQAKLLSYLWAEVVATMCYLKNWTRTTSVMRYTPFQLWTNDVPDFSNLRIFGCKAFVHVLDAKRKKLDYKTQ